MTTATLPLTPQRIPLPNLLAIKQRQQATWSTGDFSVVAARIVLEAELLAESAHLQAGWNVLDVATGSGNAALAAARRGCRSLGVDYVPALLERGRIRAEAEHLDVEFMEGDAENLPVPTGAFDAVLSIYGVMFAPDHYKTASELARACKPGGTIALASWTPEGFIGETFRAFSRRIPPAPGLTPPIQWGEESHLREIFGSSLRSIQSRVRTAIFRFASAEANVEFFRTYYGPTIKTFQSLDPATQASLAEELANLAHQFNRNTGPGPVAIEATYLESIITRA